MELIDGIKNILDGDAVVIMGAGASWGAKNAFGDFPSGSSLACELYKKCSIIPDDEKDLQDAAQCYEEKFSASALISEIRTLLTCASFTESHETIYALPWMRYYTTNYDDVALLAAKRKGVVLTPVTLTSNLKANLNTEHLCVHINGHIGNLSETTLHHEFKLTANSFYSQTNILNSQWGDFFINDLESAKCIVIIGLSLKYDLDLSKIIFSTNFIEKTMIISSPDLTSNSENRLKRFGTVHKIGVDGFAEKITEVKGFYKPHVKLPEERLYSAFNHYYRTKRHFIAPKPEDIFQLFLNGQYSDPLFYKNGGLYSGFIYRAKFAKIREAVTNGTRFIFVHADMGNGKTACINELQYSLSRENIHIFELCNADSKKISEEIAAIYSLSQNATVLIIVEDYTNYMDILHKLALLDNGRVQYILTARSALNYNKMPLVLDEFVAEEGSSAVFDINKLEDIDLKNCVKIFNQYGLFGRKSKMSTPDKIKYLTERKNGNSRFQSIMLGVIQSGMMKEKLVSIIKTIKDESKEYYNAVLLCLLVKVMNLRLSISDIERILEINLTTDALFKSNPAIKELITFNYKGELIIKAPVTARFVLQKVSAPEDIISSLCALSFHAEKYSDTPKFANLLTSIISYSHINSFLKGFSNPEQFLTAYYDELSRVEYYRNNNFFWLQYAISCIETGNFDRAQRYLDTAYGLIPDGFVPFQINNQQARFYLERIVHGQSSDVSGDFCEAHKLLMIPIISPKDNEYNVVRLFGYYCRDKVKQPMIENGSEEAYKIACKEAYTKTVDYIKKHPIYSEEFTDLQARLLSSCVS